MVWDAGKAILRGKIIAKFALQKGPWQEKLDELDKELENLERKKKKITYWTLARKLGKLKIRSKKKKKQSF